MEDGEEDDVRRLGRRGGGGLEKVGENGEEEEQIWMENG